MTGFVLSTVTRYVDVEQFATVTALAVTVSAPSGDEPTS